MNRAPDDLRVELLTTVAELREASRLLADVWGVPERESPGPVNVLRALADVGGYVAGARRAERLVGATYGLLYQGEGELCLRSQVTGTTEPGAGVGSALKHHQRAWAAERGLGAITWTFDPFVVRNARFNLGTLGASVVRFVEDFYGPLHDGPNGDAETDRVVVRWAVDGPLAVDRSVPVSAVVDVGADGGPAVRPSDAPARRIAVPERVASPRLRGAWRVALGSAVRAALADGLVGTDFCDGGYVFRRPLDG